MSDRQHTFTVVFKDTNHAPEEVQAAKWGPPSDGWLHFEDGDGATVFSVKSSEVRSVRTSAPPCCRGAGR